MTDASGRETAAFHTPAEADLQACTCGNELWGRTAGTNFRERRGDKLSGTGFGEGLRGRASGTGFRERRGDKLSETGFGEGLSGKGFREQTFGSATQGTALPDLFRPQKRDFAEFRNIFTFAMK